MNGFQGINVCFSIPNWCWVHPSCIDGRIHALKRKNHRLKTFATQTYCRHLRSKTWIFPKRYLLTTWFSISVLHNCEKFMCVSKPSTMAVVCQANNNDYYVLYRFWLVEEFSALILQQRFSPQFIVLHTLRYKVCFWECRQAAVVSLDIGRNEDTSFVPTHAKGLGCS